jgi:hypothetical protein
MAWRSLVDDLRRLQWVILLLVGVAVAVWSGTYWGWWALMWDMALPVRVAGVLGVTASVFFVWYAVLFTSHRYLGMPRDNPLLAPTRSGLPAVAPREQLPLRVMQARFEGEVLTVTVWNQGPTDTFVAEVNYISNGGPFVRPVPLRWTEAVGTEQREIVRGLTKDLEVLRVTHVKATERVPEGRFKIGPMALLSPGGEVSIGPAWHIHERVTEQMHLFGRIASVTTGIKSEFILVVTVATDGHAAPIPHVVVRAVDS